MTWLEGKLDHHGVKKVVPNKDTLEAAYRRAMKAEQLREVIDEAMEEVDEQADPVSCPKSLESTVRKILAEEPEKTWDAAIQELASHHRDKEA